MGLEFLLTGAWQLGNSFLLVVLALRFSLAVSFEDRYLAIFQELTKCSFRHVSVVAYVAFVKKNVFKIT